MCGEGLLELPLAVLCLQFQEPERILIPDGELSLVPNTNGQSLVEVGLAGQGLLVAPILNLVDENIPGPAKLSGHSQIELPLQIILALLHDNDVVRPGNFSHQ